MQRVLEIPPAAQCPLPNLCTVNGNTPGIAYGIVAPIFYNATTNGTFTLGNSTLAVYACCASNNGTIGTPSVGLPTNPPTCFLQCAVADAALEDSLVACMVKAKGPCFSHGFGGPTNGAAQLKGWAGMALGLVLVTSVLV